MHTGAELHAAEGVDLSKQHCIEVNSLVLPERVESLNALGDSSARRDAPSKQINYKVVIPPNAESEIVISDADSQIRSWVRGVYGNPVSGVIHHYYYWVDVDSVCRQGFR